MARTVNIAGRNVGYGEPAYIVAEIGTDSLETFDAVLRRIRAIKGVANSETSLLLSTQKL